ncbi:MAG: glycosyltransferase [Bacteroidales bacterium]|nr:glycosyltransferase [Bacteroidales bacterium]
MAPLFTIITVTYNAEHTLKRTLDSVAEQTCGLYEHIIMDGASSDSTVDIAQDHPNDKIDIYSEKDKGIYDAMNKALSRSKGDYVIFLNAGDKFHSPHTLQHYANAIMDNDYPGIVYGQTDIVDDEGRRLGPRHLRAPEMLTLKSFSQGMVVCHQAFAVLRQIARYYNLKYRYSSDYEWCIMCLQHSRSNIYLPEVVIDYLDQGVTTRNHRKSLQERFKIMCTYYGVVPTVMRHIGFLFRYLARRKSSANKQ